MALTLTSSAFTHEGDIPAIYTCDGEDISPPLKWDQVPGNTESFVLICDDPDAPMGIWDHWLMFNIPADTREFPENMQSLPNGAKGGKNGWGRSDYGGPCPPEGKHRYYFKFYALDTTLDLPEGASKEDIEKAMEGHILAQAELMAHYNRVEEKKD